jgi:hypothetical protein
MSDRSREENSGKALRGLSGVLPVRPVRLTRPGLRATLLGSAGALLTLMAALPFLTAPAKASIQQWVKGGLPDGTALHERSGAPVNYLKVAGHTDVPHSNSTPHGDQTDPWGTHVNVDGDHTDSAHINTTSDDDGGSKS